ncbi:MAG: DMT family transporter [Candidatus Thermoplasmatota archaeon]|nr:DMT family transporter [Candidatus Thermoplasmatota archaeon]
MQQKRLGVAAVLGASIMWAMEPVVAKLSFATADFVQTSTIRALVVLLLALAYLLLTGGRKDWRVQRREIAPLLYLALAGTLFADLLYFFALQSIPVVNAVLIGHLQPLFIVLMGWMWLRGDQLAGLDYLGMACMMLSALLVTARHPDRLLSLELGTWGDVLVLLATLAWASAAVVMRRFLRGLHAGTITLYRFAAASLALTAYSLLTSGLEVASVYQVAVGAVVGLGTILYYEGMKRMKAAQVGALELASPFFAALLGFAVLGETVTGMQMAGLTLLVAGVWLLARRE